jgi:hypothetical protein
MAYLKAKNRIHSVKKFKMSHSKNNQSMINLLFLLAVSVPQVFANDCELVREIWEVSFSKGLDTTAETCCDGIPGISCINGKVTSINWENQNLIGPIPPKIGSLMNLQDL